MTIAVNIDYKAQGGQFIFEIFIRIARRKPGHTFLFIIDKARCEESIFSKNIIPVDAPPKAKNPLLWRFWYDYSISGVLRKYKPDLFVTADLCSMRTKIPQVLIVRNLSFLHYPQFMQKSHVRFYKKYLPGSLQKARGIVTTSQYYKRELVDRFAAPKARITIVPVGIAEDFRAVSFEEREKIKALYAQGNEYFLFSNALGKYSNMMNLLKAFSIFLKRQKSHMQLLILTQRVNDDQFSKNLPLFKFKSQVKVFENIPREESIRITAAAYALINPSLQEADSWLQAIKCNVPVIVSNSGGSLAMYGDAALYINAGDPRDIAEKMMLVFKDEKLRQVLIEKGNQQRENHQWDTSSELLWKSVENATQ